MADAGELERALKTHSVRGYPVWVPLFGNSILESSTTVRNGVYYRIRPTKPLPFDQVAEEMSLDPTPKNKRQWASKGSEDWPTEEDGSLKLRSPQFVLPPEIQARLDVGESVSWKDVVEAWVARGGCLDEERRVTCYDVSGEGVIIPADQLKRGMLVEFYDEKQDKWGWAGRVVDVGSDDRSGPIVYVELFEPVPFMDTPEAFDPSKIRPGFFSSVTWKLGYGTAEAWQKSKIPMPPGEWVPNPVFKRPDYLTNEAIPLDAVRRICDKFYPGEPQCVVQSMLFYIIPIQVTALPPKHRGGHFRPVPEDAARAGVYLVWRAEGPGIQEGS